MKHEYLVTITSYLCIHDFTLLHGVLLVLKFFFFI